MRHWIKKYSIIGILFLHGCASVPHPYEGSDKSQSDERLVAQIQNAELVRKSTPKSRVIYAGFAMSSESSAFRGDIDYMEKRIKEIEPNSITFILSNSAFKQKQDLPFATSENIAIVFSAINKLARPDDRLILLFSSHGSSDYLSINIGQQEYPGVNSQAIQNALIGTTKEIPTLMIFSACHSGSLIPSLRQSNRVILTASAADRVSFGCQSKSINTYFVQALLNQELIQNKSISEWMSQAKRNVSFQENIMRLNPPSDPQIDVGSTARNWVSIPIWSWLKPNMRNPFVPYSW